MDQIQAQALSQSQKPHVAILPSPGLGHLNPLVEFARRLITDHNFTVTFLVPTDIIPPSPAEKAILHSLPPNKVDHIFLPPVNMDDLPKGTKFVTFLTLAVTRSLPALRDIFKSLVSRFKLVSLVVDLFGTDAFDVAREFNVSAYIFYTSTAMDLSLFLHLPELDETVPCEYRDLTEPVRLPGCVPIPGKDLFDPLQDRTNDAYKLVLHNATRFRLADGIMLNSFKELEPGAIQALLEKQPCNDKPKPPIYPVGPLVNMKPRVNDVESSSDALAWLDKQPRGSVLFVSFGSGGTHSSEQIHEIAMGLALSGVRFLWVVRRPFDKKDDGATYFGRNDRPSFDFLPDGFLEGTKGVGLVMHPWAPQAQILAHESTAGFMTHCGWNSSLESVINGVPLVAWPLYAEQRMNALVLTQEMKVALRPKASENGVVKREEIAKVVKSLIEGEEGKRLRKRIEELKEAATKTLSQDGASTKALSEVVAKWKNKLCN